MNMSKLNVIAANTSLPMKQLSELEKDEFHMITALSMVEKKIIVELNEEFQIILPTRVCKILYENELFYEDMEAKANKLQLFLLYLGNDKIEFC